MSTRTRLVASVVKAAKKETLELTLTRATRRAAIRRLRAQTRTEATRQQA